MSKTLKTFIDKGIFSVNGDFAKLFTAPLLLGLDK
jgi:hypothetical protein